MYFEESIQEENFCRSELFLNGTEPLNMLPSGTETQGEITGGPGKTPATTHAHKTGRRN